jgi:Protein of unknown function (DUF2637)
MTPAHDPRGPLTVLSTPPNGASPVNHSAADGPGLFEIANPNQAHSARHVTTVRRLAGAGRAPGTMLISAAAWLLVAIGAGALYVSFDAQRQYVFTVRQHQAAAIIEALLLDLLMIVFTLLALGLSRAGKSSRTERALILACAAASAYMNVSDADTASPRSVAAYILAPLTLAVVVDRVVAVIRRHVLADEEPSAWAGPGRAAAAGARAAGLLILYTLRFLLAPPETATGLRRHVLQAAPLPPVQSRTNNPYGRTGPRTGPWPVSAVDRDTVVARLADEIRDAIAAGERWQPDYPALMQATGRRRSWCEKAVRDARTAVFDTPDDESPS